MMYGFSNNWAIHPLNIFGIGSIGVILMLLFVAGTIALKGYALWHAARRSEKGWFIALLIVNTLGILELAYLYFVVGKWQKFKDNGTPPSTSSGTSASTSPTDKVSN